MTNSDDQTTHVNQTRRLISSFGELQSESNELISKAKRSIQIYSKNLDPRILNDRNIEKNLIQFIKQSRAARIQGLIFDENQLRGVDHRLVSLAQRFTSFIEIRIIPKDYHENHFAFYLSDKQQIIYRNNSERYEAEYAKLPHALVKEKSKWFDELWQHSSPASFLRTLHI